jgi:hypothetical protein
VYSLKVLERLFPRQGKLPLSMRAGERREGLDHDPVGIMMQWASSRLIARFFDAVSRSDSRVQSWQTLTSCFT